MYNYNRTFNTSISVINKETKNAENLKNSVNQLMSYTEYFIPQQEKTHPPLVHMEHLPNSSYSVNRNLKKKLSYEECPLNTMQNN